MSPSCSPAPTPFVDTLDDVLVVVEASVRSRRRGSGDRLGTVALLLDLDDRLITAVECVGCDTSERVVELCSVLLAAAPGASSWRACVLVTAAPPWGDGLDAPWRALRSSFDAAGVDLVDWLLVPADLPLDPFAVRSASAEIDGIWPW